MSFQLLRNHLAPAEGEIAVRSYHCTQVSPAFGLIGLKTDGYLTVTNKRMIFYAEGSSAFGAAGESKLYDEVPLADVANISLSRGTRFSFLRLLAGLLFGQIPAALIVLAFVLAAGALTRLTGADNAHLLRLAMFLQLSTAGLFVLLSFSIPRENLIRLMLAAAGLALVATIPVLGRIPGTAHLGLLPVYDRAMLILALPLLCYWALCLYWFFRRQYLTLAIRSKTNWPPAIQIAGVSWWGRINVAADLAYGMAPAVDADAMFKELGAMVTDIQTLGDHGIAKWQQPDAGPAAETSRRGLTLFAFPRGAMRYALTGMAALAVLLGAESLWSVRIGKERLAMQVRHDLARVRGAVQNDPAAKTWTPKLLAAAEREAAAGETAFAASKFTDAMAHWKVASDAYHAIPGAAAALQKASALQAEYKKGTGGLYLQENAHERLKPGQLMKAFSVLIDQHPTPNEPWKIVRESTTEARGMDEQDKWEQLAPHWVRAGSRLTQATRLMHADIAVKQAEAEIKKDNAAGAIAFADKALQEMPDYAPAIQRKRVAVNMRNYAELLRGNAEEGTVPSAAEFARQLDQFGGTEWKTVQSLVENARAAATRSEWDKCHDAWESALSKMPAVLLAVRLERLEIEARRGNWTTVAALAGSVLREQPRHARAGELKRKADGIVAAHRAELAYLRGMSAALNQEVTEGRIKVGDMTDFIAHMDRYGREEWAQMKEAMGKAEGFSQNEQGAESLAEWTKVNALFAAAVQRMRAEILLEQAEFAAKSNQWSRVLVHAERALTEKPDHARARQLRDQADSIEEKRLRPSN